jgi:hypothetical protein
MYRRRRGRRVPVIVALVVVIGGGIVGMKLWPGASQPAPADASTNPTDGTPPSVGPEPAMMTAMLATEDEKPAKPAPPRVNMGPSPQQIAEAAQKAAPPVEEKPLSASSAVQESPAAPTDPNTQIGRSEQPNQTPPPPPASPTTSTGTAAQRMAAGMDLLARNKAVDARKLLTEALLTPAGAGALSTADADRVRTTLSELNQKLVFGTEVAPNDPYARIYAIEAGDVLAKLTRKLSLNVDWRFLQRINRLQDPTRIQVGQKIKIVTGPFHAVVNKRDFRLDLYMGNGDSRVFVRSFPVGLGEFDATPEGVFMIRPNSKLINPEWVNPRTGERFFADDPNNPIGERWIGLVGVSDNIRDLSGYGIHGTIDPDSIGRQKSMGCVRMNEEDVGLIYEVLMENVSRVEIQGEDYP